MFLAFEVLATLAGFLIDIFIDILSLIFDGIFVLIDVALKK